MLDPQASRFWQAAVFSGLMDVEGLNACWNAIPPGSGMIRSTSTAVWRGRRSSPIP